MRQKSGSVKEEVPATMKRVPGEYFVSFPTMRDTDPLRTQAGNARRRPY